MSASIFYLGYIAGSYPNVLLAQRFRINRFLFVLILVWGICLIATASVTNWQGLYVQRFFLGLLESGVAPTFMMVVGQWYKKSEQSLRMGSVYSSCVHACLTF
jgi:MFS family permease